MFEFGPHGVVDAGFVPGVENFAALGGVVAELVNGDAFEDGGVVGGFFAGIWHAEIEVSEVVVT